MLEFVNHLAERGGEGVGGLRFGIKDGKALQPEIGGKPLDISSKLLAGYERLHCQWR